MDAVHAKGNIFRSTAPFYHKCSRKHCIYAHSVWAAQPSRGSNLHPHRLGNHHLVNARPLAAQPHRFVPVYSLPSVG